MQLYFALALSAAALTALVVRLRMPAPASQMQLAAFHLGPFLAVWLVALLTPAHDVTFYKGFVLVGMILAIIGYALHESDFLPSYVTHAFLGITYVLYAYAFSSQTSGWPTPWVILLLAAAAGIYYWLYPRLYELWISIAIYSLFMFLATWQSLELFVQHPGGLMGIAAFSGMLLALIATLLEAQGRFHSFRPGWASYILPTFLLAQLAVAWSIWG